MNATATNKNKLITFDDGVQVERSGQVWPYEIWSYLPRYLVKGCYSLAAAEKALNAFTFKSDYVLVNVKKVNAFGDLVQGPVRP